MWRSVRRLSRLGPFSCSGERVEIRFLDGHEIDGVGPQPSSKPSQGGPHACESRHPGSHGE